MDPGAFADLPSNMIIYKTPDSEYDYVFLCNRCKVAVLDYTLVSKHSETCIGYFKYGCMPDEQNEQPEKPNEQPEKPNEQSEEPNEQQEVNPGTKAGPAFITPKSAPKKKKPKRRRRRRV